MSISRLRGIFNNDKGGSYSNEYEVKFTFDPTNNSDIIARLKYYGFNLPSGKAYDDMMFLCDEASLPGTFSATNEIDGVYGGRLIQYPHAKLYNDMRLSFIQTNQLNPQKFFEAWMGGMFPEYSMKGTNVSPIQPAERTRRREVTNTVSLSYYKNMVCKQMTVTKSYKTKDDPAGATSCYYDMFNVYPYSIESVPLSYGASTLNKLRVSFRYEKHVVIFYDQKGREF